jgi:hypothetical protein
MEPNLIDMLKVRFRRNINNRWIWELLSPRDLHVCNRSELDFLTLKQCEADAAVKGMLAS